MVRRFGWGFMTLLAALVATYALAAVFSPSARVPFVNELFSTRWARTLGHLAAGGVALVAGALQFSTRLRFGAPKVHRRVGWAYLVAVLVGGVAGGLLAPWSDGGIPGHFGFGLLALLWVTTTVTAVMRARAGDYASHRTWMIRSYAFCLAAVTLRIYLPLSAVAGIPFDSAYPAIAWLCWVPNLVVAEWFVLPSSIAPLQPAG